MPAAGNAISNGMIVGALASGLFTGSVKNMQMALDVAGGAVRVTGSSQSVNIATLQHALKDFQGRSNARVHIDAGHAQIAKLRRLAEPKGIIIHGGQ